MVSAPGNGWRALWRRRSRAAVFGAFELLDTSEEGQLTGERADQTRRVALASAELNASSTPPAQIAEVDLAPRRRRSRRVRRYSSAMAASRTLPATSCATFRSAAWCRRPPT